LIQFSSSWRSNPSSWHRKSRFCRISHSISASQWYPTCRRPGGMVTTLSMTCIRHKPHKSMHPTSVSKQGASSWERETSTELGADNLHRETHLCQEDRQMVAGKLKHVLRRVDARPSAHHRLQDRFLQGQQVADRCMLHLHAINIISGHASITVRSGRRRRHPTRSSSLLRPKEATVPPQPILCAYTRPGAHNRRRGCLRARLVRARLSRKHLAPVPPAPQTAPPSHSSLRDHRAPIAFY
jgi:hypothetical protein